MFRVTDRYDTIERAVSKAGQMCAVLGFDGFIDVVVRVVKRYEKDSVVFFERMEELADFVRERAGKSCGLEFKTQTEKIGGNAPLMACALRRLGSDVELIGALGTPAVHPMFLKELEVEPKSLYGCAAPGVATAMEFQNGKIMTGAIDSLNGLGWRQVKESVTLPGLIRLYAQADLACMLNWSEVINSNEIWEGLLREVLPAAELKPNAIACFDLSDCARRSEVEQHQMLKLMQQFRKYFFVVLNVNQNEHNILYHTVLGKGPPMTLENSRLAEALDVDLLCIHYRRGCVAFRQGQVCSVNNYFIENPVLLTGAGDNFNSGLVFALHCGLELEDALLVGNAVSGFYVSNGFSPGRTELLQYLRDWGARETAAEDMRSLQTMQA